jgi:glycosyltransferase involved in cell wall biosynthesis
VTTDSPPGAAWLREFERRTGRPLRLLHIGNIANNAYINAKIQRRIGIEADVCCYDYFHVMGCPEWEDAEFEGDVVDPFFPDWWAVDLKGFKRPAWFAQGRQRTCQRYLIALRRNDRRLIRLLGRQLRFELWLRCRSTRWARVVAAFVGVARGSMPEAPRLPPLPHVSRSLEAWLEWLPLAASWLLRGLVFAVAWFRWRLRVTVMRRVRYAFSWYGSLSRTSDRKSTALARAGTALARGGDWRTSVLMVFPRRLSRVARTDEHRAMVAAAQEAASPTAAASQSDARLALYDSLFGDRLSPMSPDDYADFLPAMPEWRSLLDEYDIVQCYATDPLIPLLSGFQAYTAYEHGTLRDLPFEDSARGRLCALSYRTAPQVFVTNSDVLPSARRLGLRDEQMVFLPHAVDSERLQRFREEHEHVRPAAGAPVVFISPTRHDWADGDPLWAKGNDRLIRALAIVRDEGLPCTLLLLEWGRHVAESKLLVDELGVADRVSWLPTMRKRSLWEAYMSAHAVVDQFLTPAMGSVTFESLALGCRVLTALDPTTIEEFFGEMPPVLNCASVDEIAAAMRRVIADPTDSAGVGRAAEAWFAAHHSTERILELELSAYARVLAQEPIKPRNA